MEVQKSKENKEKSVISFNQHSFDTGITTAISKGAYLSLLFPNHTEFLKKQIEDYINVINIYTPDFGMIVLNPDGNAKVFDYNYNLKWSGSLKHKGYAPRDATMCDGSLWCSYPDSNTLIKYNTSAYSQEFKISSGAGAQLIEPCGLFAGEHSIAVTSPPASAVLSLDLESFKLTTLYELSEPPRKYIKVDSNEIVMTNTGIYKL